MYDPNSFRSEEHLRRARAQIRTHAVKITKQRLKGVRRVPLRDVTFVSHRHNADLEVECPCGCRERSVARHVFSSTQPSKALLLSYDTHILPKFMAFQVDAPQEVGVPVWTEPCVDIVVKSPRDSLAGLSIFAYAAEYDHRAQSLGTSNAAYTEAITALRKCIQRNDPEDITSIMFSVVMLGIWESLSSLRLATPPKLIHQNAGIDLIRLYGSRVLENNAVRHLAQTLLSRYIWAAYLPTAIHMTAEPDLPKGLYSYNHREALPQLEELAASVAQLRFIAKDAWTGIYDLAIAGKGQTDRLIRRAMKVNSNLDHWERMLPLSYQPRAITDISCIDISIRQVGMYRDLCEIYPSHEKAQNYNRWRTLKLYCLITLLLIQRDLVDESTIKSIRYILDRICACVPFQVGNLSMAARVNPIFPPILMGGHNPCKFTNRHGDAITYTYETHTSTAQRRGDMLMLETLSATLQTLGHPNFSKMQDVMSLLKISPADDIEQQVGWIGSQLQRALDLRCKQPF